MSYPDATTDGWTLAVAATNRHDMRVLFYPDGRRAFQHTCTVPGAERPDLATITAAPWLQHDIGATAGDFAETGVLVTVSPSILCLRCKTHGFWTANEWRDA